MSSQKNSWQSCHRLNGGGYRAGCQSYMCDSVSMIFFTVDDNIKADFYHAPRLTRQIFCYKDGLLLQSRLYPNNEDDVRKLYRGLVQGAVAQCLGVPNLWSVKSKREETQALLETAKHSLHYPDYEYSYGVVSLLNGTPSAQKIVIGSRSLCTCCGQPHDYSNALKCSSCKSVVVCKECGRVVPTDEAHYMEEAFFCRDCVTRCEMCGSLSACVNTATHPQQEPAVCAAAGKSARSLTPGAFARMWNTPRQPPRDGRYRNGSTGFTGSAPYLGV